VVGIIRQRSGEERSEPV